MSIRSIALATAVIAFSVQAISARVDVKVDFDKAFNFKGVKTWGWHADGPGEVKMARTQTDDPVAMTKAAEPPIVDAVTIEMKRIGLPQAPADPDLAVHYYLLLTTNQSAQTIGQFLPSTMSWGLPLFPQATQSLKVLNQGALVLDLSAKGAVVWRGVAQAEIKPEMDFKKREALLREGVRDLLKRYPPKPVIVIGKSTALAIGLALFLVPAISAAQDLTPRAYFPAPEQSNAFIFTYAFSKGELVFDPTLPITDASGTIHAPVVSLYHAFGIFGRSASITGSVPFATGHFTGTVGGEHREATRTGVADTVVRLAVNLVGGPSLSVAEFVKTPISRALVGASIKVVAPTGQYDPTLLINIGANRWGFKPEIGYTGRAGNFVIDAFAGIWLFTANDEFGVSAANPLGATRTQDPIGAFELHVSYDVKPRLWLSADINYWRGGRTSVNGVEGSQTLQANSRFGLTGSVPLSRRHSLKVSYSDGVIVRIGGNFRVLSVGYQYGWIGKQWK